MWDEPVAAVVRRATFVRARRDRVGLCHTDAKIATGATIYGNYCSNCHGDELRNTSGGVTFDLTRLRAADHDRFVNSVLNGKTQMPPWRDVLDMEQIESVWSFIRATVDR